MRAGEKFEIYTFYLYERESCSRFVCYMRGRGVHVLCVKSCSRFMCYMRGRAVHVLCVNLLHFRAIA